MKKNQALAAAVLAPAVAVALAHQVQVANQTPKLTRMKKKRYSKAFLILMVLETKTLTARVGLRKTLRNPSQAMTILFRT